MKTQIIISRSNYSTFNSEFNFSTIVTLIHSEFYFKVHSQHGQLLSTARPQNYYPQNHKTLLDDAYIN